MEKWHSRRYANLVQAMVMVDVDVLTLAVPTAYKFNHSGKSMTLRI
jgi:hypothetical protein